jgi:DNA polymerase elongation subunit (family B)
LKFYTNVSRKGNNILERGYEDGRPYKKVIPYKPYLFVNSTQDSKYKTIHDKPVSRIDFPSMKDAKNYIDSYKDVSGHEIYGLTNYEFTYIYDNFEKGFEYDFSLLNIVNIDIETMSDTGFPSVEKADKEITAITLCKGDKSITFGCREYTKGTEERAYVKCKNEADLLEKFLIIWNTKKWLPDIITGWNIEFFDIPYLVNRIFNVLGESAVLKLSPFKTINLRIVRQKNGKEFNAYSILGLSIIDYYDLYKKFAQNERESYKLDYIAEIELGENKLDYSEYGSLHQLYVQNYEKYIDYNIHDAILIGRLENKLHYIEQVVAIAYIQRVNFENTLTTVKPWDILIHNYLMDQHIVVPQFELDDDAEPIMGGYVKEPEPGLYNWVVSVDFTSLYPSIAMQYNISPDTFVSQFPNKPDLKDIFNGNIKNFTNQLIQRDLTMTANGCLFKRNKRGFIPAIMNEFFEERKRFRVLEAEANKIYKDSNKDEDRNVYLKYKNIQTAFKLINNSGYGALLNPYFRWFADYLGEAITSSGRMTTQYVEIKVNAWLNEIFKTKDVVYVIYCDTDSAYITLDYLIKKTGITDIRKATEAIVRFSENKLCPYIDKVCKELADSLNAYEFKTSMKIEKVCDQVFFIRKKRYALNVCYEEGLYFDEPKLKVTGLETVRSSVPKVCREALKDCFKIIFQRDNDKLLQYVVDFKKKFFALKFENISKPSSVNGIDKYYDENKLVKLRCPIHVRGSIVFNEFIKKNNLTDKYELILDHDKIKFSYLKLPNPTKQNVIAIKNDNIPKELDIEEFLDYDTQYTKMFLEPLRVVCDAIGWDIERVYRLDDLLDFN